MMKIGRRNLLRFTAARLWDDTAAIGIRYQRPRRAAHGLREFRDLALVQAHGGGAGEGPEGLAVPGTVQGQFLGQPAQRAPTVGAQLVALSGRPRGGAPCPGAASGGEIRFAMVEAGLVPAAFAVGQPRAWAAARAPAISRAMSLGPTIS